MNRIDLLIVGAGPSGMAAAILACRQGLQVTVIDDHARPGGHVWSLEGTARHQEVSNISYDERRMLCEAFDGCGANFQPQTELWRIDHGFRAFVSRNCQASVIHAKTVILATGAQERPVPFSGWTLPGVLTVGAAQILLKCSRQVPIGPLWIAGSGPLPLIYALQLLRAGGNIAGYLDTTPVGQWRHAARHLPRASKGAAELIRGLRWMAALRRSKTPVTCGVVEVEAIGRDRVEALSYRTNGGPKKTVPVNTLLVHEGLVPRVHPALSLNCAVTWQSLSHCYAPIVDGWGESSVADLLIAGDSAGIGGFHVARLRGELAALRVAGKLGYTSERKATRTARRIRRKLKRELAVRPFLDAMFRPRVQVFAPNNTTVVCRCEDVTAGDIRAAAALGKPGPNQIKAATRAGMGSCQGRQCGYTVTCILSATQDRTPGEIGFFNIRSPLRPVTLGELASLDEGDFKNLRSI